MKEDSQVFFHVLTKENEMKHTELHTGIDGLGETIYMVVTVSESGRWIHTEYFDTESEALCWMKYSISITPA